MKFNIDIGEIITKSWKITWKFKVLWIFGILSGCVASRRSNFNFNSGGGGGGGNNGIGGNGELPEFLRQFQNMRPEQAVREFLGQYTVIIAVVILLLCVLWLVFYFLGIMGRIGLIKGAGKADAGAETLTFGELWTESLPYFWRMFGISLIIGLPAFIVTVLLLVALGLGAYTAVTGDMSQNSMIAMFVGLVGTFVLLVCCLSLIMLVVGLIVEQSYNAIVLEDRSLLESLGRGWNIFRQNFLSIIVVGVLQWILGVIIGIVIAIPMIIAVIPVAVIAAFVASTSNWIILAVLVGGCICLLIPVSLLLGGIENTYFQSMWTLTYRRLTASVEPRLPAQVELIEPQ
jgi:hypothetical protein